MALLGPLFRPLYQQQHSPSRCHGAPGGLFGSIGVPPMVAATVPEASIGLISIAGRGGMGTSPEIGYCENRVYAGLRRASYSSSGFGPGGTYPLSGTSVYLCRCAGAGYAITAPFTPSRCQRTVWRTRRFPTIFGRFTISLGFGTAAGAWAGGKIFDVTGSYTAAFLGAFGLILFPPALSSGSSRRGGRTPPPLGQSINDPYVQCPVGARLPSILPLKFDHRVRGIRPWSLPHFGIAHSRGVCESRSSTVADDPSRSDENSAGIKTQDRARRLIVAATFVTMVVVLRQSGTPIRCSWCLVREFAWSRSLVAGAFSVFILIHGSLGPPIGWLARRFGPRRLFLAGAVVIGIGLALTAEAPSVVASVPRVSGVTAIGMSLADGSPAVVLIPGVVPNRFGTAMGMRRRESGSASSE